MFRSTLLDNPALFKPCFIAAIRPSIMSDGAIISAPASPNSTEISAKRLMLAGLSISLSAPLVSSLNKYVALIQQESIVYVFITLQ